MERIEEKEIGTMMYESLPQALDWWAFILTVLCGFIPGVLVGKIWEALKDKKSRKD